MRISMRIASIGALAMTVPLVFSACATEDNRSTIVITVCDLRPADRVGAVEVVTTASGAEYLILPSEDLAGMWQGQVYEINIEPSRDTDNLIVGHKQLDEKAEPCP